MEKSMGLGGMVGEERFYYSMGIFPDFFVRMGKKKKITSAPEFSCHHLTAGTLL